MPTSLRSLRSGQDVIAAMKSCFGSSRLLREVNSTAISLILKVSKPFHLKNFRPISCCNTIYKCISKELVNHLQAVLNDIVRKQQTAFISSRRIGDNILMAHELLRNYHTDKGSPMCALKVDVMKVYDYVNWNFFCAALRSIRVPKVMVQWIEECITTPRSSICINVKVKGFFSRTRSHS